MRFEFLNSFVQLSYVTVTYAGFILFANKTESLSDVINKVEELSLIHISEPTRPY